MKQFATLLERDQVQREWAHANWWGFLLTLLQQRRGYFVAPLRLQWCPAHLLEHVESQALTDEAATLAGSNKQDIMLNRFADKLVKAC